jgi:2,3,4,5-tetrahydropyridine-2-carboxylate N-succinyltransferase
MPEASRGEQQAARLTRLRVRIDMYKDATRSEIGLRGELPQALEAFSELCSMLNDGAVRAAERNGQTGAWTVNPWVKIGILLGMKLGVVKTVTAQDDELQFSDKDTLRLRTIDAVADNIRVVPGGSSIRNGSHIGHGVIMMPPSYVNIGAYVGDKTMIDSHALVGSCAQVGENCHISAGAQIGGVLEPINASPCIVGDRVFMGINSSIAEGAILGDGVVLASGVNITASTPVYDAVLGKIYEASAASPIVVPDNAVVIPGTRPFRAGNAFADREGLMVATPIIVKYRDERTDAKTALEQALR